MANSITLKDWAYENSGSPIHPGDTGLSAAPEPSTAAMALLAAGAAGIVALRRRRKSAA
jgi:MYXO-CTERM domain-containing protein